jgi:phosphinothricin acetyltransferase
MPVIRRVTGDDAARVAEIYEPYVRETAVSFELEPPGAEEMRRRIESVTGRHPWLIIDDDGLALGYAYASPYRERPAYNWTVETTVYIDRERRGQGLGKALYAALLEELTSRGFVTAFAGITVPNPWSEALHASVGFEQIGVLPRAGFKLGEWRDVAFWHRPLRPHTTDPTI